MKTYDRIFFSSLADGSYRSALEILPAVFELVGPEKIVDVGCGDGAWLAACLELGAKAITGVDGIWVDRTALRIPEGTFVAHDLTAPLVLNQTYDLAISLEVGEHLPARCAETYIASLVGLAPVIMFSAAIHGQIGVNHINEQWPDYWAPIFKKHCYMAIDCLRGRFWLNESVEPWYRQNIMLYAEESYIKQNERLNALYMQTNMNQISVVHPRIWQDDLNSWQYAGFMMHLRALPHALTRSLKRSASRYIRRVYR